MSVEGAILDLEKKIATAVTDGNAADAAALADARKALAEGSNEVHRYLDHLQDRRYELLKTIASSTVPLLTLVTLLVTVWIQANQLEVSRTTAEQISWREMIGHFSKSSKGEQTDEEGIATAAELKSFFHSDQYGSQAQDMAILLLPRVLDPDCFADLYHALVEAADWTRFDAILKSNKMIASRIAVMDRCIVDLGSCQRDMPQLHNVSVEAIRNDELAVLRNVALSGADLARILRSGIPRGKVIDLDGALFYRSDLSGVDLSHVRFGTVRFVATALKDAVLVDIRDFDQSQWSGEPWWEAARVSPPLLQFLSTMEAPTIGDAYPDHPLTQDEYIAGVRHLRSDGGVDVDAAIQLLASDTAAASEPAAGPVDAQSAPATARHGQESGDDEFKVGFVVRLRSGGPLMTVLEPGRSVKCTWFADGRSEQSYFPLSVLELATEIHDAPVPPLPGAP
jgi:uncharacterized protein YodC (DUF2158 family)/uncharacterized protein YjbI with pentapeptide repeats